MTKYILITLLLASGIFSHDRLWTASVISASAGIGLDLASSYGEYEANPRLRGADGRLGAKGVAINVGVVSALITSRLLGKHLPGKFKRVLTVVNFSFAGARVGIAARNWRLR